MTAYFLLLSTFARAEILLPRAVVTQHLTEARDCYVSRVKQGLTKEGRLVISWTINEQGQAVAPKSRLNELGDAKLYDCLAEKIKTWKFSPSEKSKIQNFLFPFIFRLKEN